MYKPNLDSRDKRKINRKERTEENPINNQVKRGRIDKHENDKNGINGFSNGVRRD